MLKGSFCFCNSLLLQWNFFPRECHSPTFLETEVNAAHGVALLFLLCSLQMLGARYYEFIVKHLFPPSIQGGAYIIAEMSTKNCGKEMQNHETVTV